MLGSVIVSIRFLRETNQKQETTNQNRPQNFSGRINAYIRYASNASAMNPLMKYSRFIVFSLTGF
jgi:hypothetical protein